VRTQQKLSLSLAEALTVLFRDSSGELANLRAGESEIFCLLAGGVEIAGDEPRFDGIGVVFLGVDVCDRLPGCALPRKY